LARALTRLAQLNQSKVYLFWKSCEESRQICSLVPSPVIWFAQATPVKYRYS